MTFRLSNPNGEERCFFPLGRMTEVVTSGTPSSVPGCSAPWWPRLHLAKLPLTLAPPAGGDEWNQVLWMAGLPSDQPFIYSTWQNRIKRTRCVGGAAWRSPIVVVPGLFGAGAPRARGSCPVPSGCLWPWLGCGFVQPPDGIRHSRCHCGFGLLQPDPFALVMLVPRGVSWMGEMGRCWPEPVP